MNAPQAFEIKEDIAHYIGGQIVLPQGTRFADVHNPAKGSIARRVALASKADVGKAVAAAQAAFPAWGNTSPLRRARILFKYLDLLNRHRDELAAIITGVTHGAKITGDQLTKRNVNEAMRVVRAGGTRNPVLPPPNAIQRGAARATRPFGGMAGAAAVRGLLDGP